MNRLELDDTKLLYIGPPNRDGTPGRCFHLSGVNSGMEGVILSDHPDGFEFGQQRIVKSKGAKQPGAKFLRALREEREFDFTVHIFGRTAREAQMRRTAWFRSWSTSRPGHLCFFSQNLGWHFIRTQRSDDPPRPTLGADLADPLQYGFTESYEMHVVSMDSDYSSFDEEITWVNTLGLNETTLRARNTGEYEQWPRYTMNGPGRWWIEDPLDTEHEIRLLSTPMLSATEELRIDTNPQRRTARVYSPATGIDGRNVWGQLGGRRWIKPVPAGESKEIVVRIEGGNLASSIILQGTPKFEGPY
ncbi:phage tail protein [Rhodococcus aetherivorans]|uniref:phage tail protein n=1 Tax=Rhodococcus aetherivorans TaxID=191292 RepID=UPI003EB6EE0B